MTHDARSCESGTGLQPGRHRALEYQCIDKWRKAEGIDLSTLGWLGQLYS